MGVPGRRRGQVVLMSAEDWITLILTIEFAAIILYMVFGEL